MTRIDIDALAPWDLTLVLAGEPVATRKPTWEDVQRLHDAGKSIQARPDDPELPKTLREALGAFSPESAAAILDRLAFDDLMAAFLAADAYFKDWLKKKSAAAVKAAVPEAVPAPAGPPVAPSTPTARGR
jgi:hypothetical protein